MSLSLPQLLIILVIAVLIFGTKKFKNIGRDVGGAVKDFKDAVKEDEAAHAKKHHKIIEHEAADEVNTSANSKVDDKHHV